MNKINFSIHEDCINCGACLNECPSNAINKNNYPPVSKEIYFIVSDLCTECSGVSDYPLCSDICPMKCIY
ncbi:MAG: 4Fe-4S dicluster domain-containing protein [Ignavibacteriaceae bacterium]|nr:4Fe-4S dicluster domain-containing protein [Ignavibacteriaceae bacterium]